jgi:hypothetical protein
MPSLFVESWRLRQHAVVEERVRGGSRRRRTDGPWTLPADVREPLRPILEAGGFDLSAEISVQERADRDGFEFVQ